MSTQSESTESLRVIVPLACTSRCRKLQERLDDATTRMREDPDVQMAVVCQRKALFGCSAHTLVAGQHEHWQDSRVFLPNPAIYEGYGTVTHQIQIAIDQGAVAIDIDVRNTL